MELEFQISHNEGIPMEFDQKEFYEFLWWYERLVDERKKENERAMKDQGKNNLGTGNPFAGGMTGGSNR
jgi:hypothetical protein